MVTLRVYDAGKKFDVCDRYTLYVPMPRNKVKEFGMFGTFCGFNFGTDNFGKGYVTRFCWDECRTGVQSMSLGKKIKRETLPTFVKEWINEMERIYNTALKKDTEEAWGKWMKC